MFRELLNRLVRLRQRHVRVSARTGIRTLATCDLGLGWSGNTVNMAIFRHHGILTYSGKQVTAFYRDERTIRIAMRNLQDGSIEFFDLSGNYNLVDAHNSISIGFDRAGYLHIAYDHHASKLRYRRATTPYAINAWSDEISMTDISESCVTYPTFILPCAGSPLSFLYRDGTPTRGAARMKIYSEATATWDDASTAVLSGAEHSPWTSNPYWNHPALGNDGEIHLSFVWRVNSVGNDNRVNNVSICYAKSDCGRSEWTSSNGYSCKTPITQVNADCVKAVSPGENLMNQCSMAVDSRNNPHIVYYANDEHGIPQYQHLWHDGLSWHHSVISQRKLAFNLAGLGTLQIPISRPEIVIDNSDNVIVIFRSVETRQRMAAQLLYPPSYIPDYEVKVLVDEDVGFAEPVIDRQRWKDEAVLSILLQRCDQPDHDVGFAANFNNIRIVDLKVGDFYA